MNRYSIALYPGDGIGVDVVEAAVKVLDAVSGESFAMDFQVFDWGASYNYNWTQVRAKDGTPVRP